VAGHCWESYFGRGVEEEEEVLVAWALEMSLLKRNLLNLRGAAAAGDDPWTSQLYWRDKG
jgi:hypothetical protein